ncbi:MAG: helicase-related protein, partial [Psychrobacter sp.]
MGKPIEVMTPGTYLRVMHELDEYEDKPVLVIGDEIHERNFELELAVAASVEEIRDHPKWRLMLVSATLDSNSIHEAYSEINGRPIPIVSAEGRPHELEQIEEPDMTAVEALKHYISKGHKKALLFTAGKQEIRDYTDEIRSARLSNMRVDPLHAKLSRANKRRATHAKLADGQKQTIPSTNAAQSGITIPDLTLVISDGLTRRKHIDHDGTESLVTDYCAQDEMIQQAGRAGRDVGGGMVVYVKPPDEYHEYKSLVERVPRSPAEIYSTNISSSVLLTTAIGKNMYNLNKL